MREDKFKPIEARFLSQLGVATKKIDSTFDHAVCYSWVYYPSNEDESFGFFDLGIDCVFHDAPYDCPDNISLIIIVEDRDSRLDIMADVVWGEGGGRVATVFPHWTPINEKVLQTIELKLADLIEALTTAIRDYPNSFYRNRH